MFATPTLARLALGDVSELQMTARSKNARYLREHLLLVGTQVDDAIGDHHVGPAILDRQLFENAFTELDVSQSHGLRRLARLGQHLFRHVDADHVSLWTDLTSSDEAIEPCTGPKVYDALARLRCRNENGLATPANDSTASSGIASTVLVS